MKIIILGAGQVGSTLAENLARDNEITVIDNDESKLAGLQAKHDLQVIQGNGASPRILREAGAGDADLLVAVTNNDDTNMIACQIAYTLFKIPTKLARIRNPDYVREQDILFNNKVLPIDHIIAPELLVTEQIFQLINYSGALQISHFAENKVSLVSVKAYYGGTLVGYPISSLEEHLPHIQAKIVCIIRQGRTIVPQATTIIESDDEVFFICEKVHIKAIMSELQRLEKQPKRIMIVGAGDIATKVASSLETQCRVKLIEKDPKKAELLAEKLSTTLVLNGNASDKELLFEEHIENIDLFLSLTDDDETNIMSALLAKRMGAKKTVVLVQRNVYLDLIQGGAIDLVISPQQTTISTLLTHVRRGDIVKVASLNQGLVEGLEIIVHGDQDSSKVVDREIQELKLPFGAIIGAIVRQEEVIIAYPTFKINAGDHLIIFLNDQRQVEEIEKLFQLSATFL